MLKTYSIGIERRLLTVQSRETGGSCPANMELNSELRMGTLVVSQQ